MTTPEPPAGETKQQPIPPATMELTATGTGAKPTITKPAKPFDAKGMMGGAAPKGTSKKKK